MKLNDCLRALWNVYPRDEEDPILGIRGADGLTPMQHALSMRKTADDGIDPVEDFYLVCKNEDTIVVLYSPFYTNDVDIMLYEENQEAAERIVFEYDIYQIGEEGEEIQRKDDMPILETRLLNIRAFKQVYKSEAERNVRDKKNRLLIRFPQLIGITDDSGKLKKITNIEKSGKYIVPQEGWTVFLEYGEVYDRYTLTDKYSDETDDENEGVSYTKPIRDLADDPEPTVRIQPYYEQYFERDKKGVLWECRELKFQRVPVDLQRYDESDAAYQQRLRSYKVALEKADELLKKTLEAGRKPVWCKRAKEPKR